MRKGCPTINLLNLINLSTPLDRAFARQAQSSLVKADKAKKIYLENEVSSVPENTA